MTSRCAKGCERERNEDFALGILAPAKPATTLTSVSAISRFTRVMAWAMAFSQARTTDAKASGALVIIFAGPASPVPKIFPSASCNIARQYVPPPSMPITNS